MKATNGCLFEYNYSGSQSQNALYTTIAASTSISDHKRTLGDPRSTEEILADELPIPEEPDALEKAAIRLHAFTQTHTMALIHKYTPVKMAAFVIKQHKFGQLERFL